MRTLAVVLLLGASACKITRPFEPEPDVVALGVLLVAGEDEARLLATHPHRERGEAAPNITAELVGPGWRAAFSDTLPLEACTAAEEWRGPTRCLGAALPATIQGNVEYSLRGRAPLGSFGGRITVPAPPHLIVPPDTLRLAIPSRPELLGLFLRHEVGLDVGTLLVELLDAFETQEDGTVTEIPAERMGFSVKTIELRESNAVSIRHRGRPARFTLRLHGLGWRYTTFMRHRGRTDPLVRPWPKFGIEGQGGYGYFDGVAISRRAHIFLE